MTKVIYITGSGRSGSTLLNALLGSAGNAVGVGELLHLPRSSGAIGEYCACGLAVNHCSVWTEIRKLWCGNTGSVLQDLALAQAAVERSRVLYRPVLGVGRNQIVEYGRLVASLYEAIAEVSGANLIIDSSKNPLRAMALTRVPNVDLRLVHLVRDVRGVAWSLMKGFAKNKKSGVYQSIEGRSPLRSVAHWSRINTFAEMAMSAVPRDFRIRLRYEDLVSQPASAIDNLSQIIDVEDREVFQQIDITTPISFGHMVAGNRVRMAPSVLIKQDFEWRQIMDRSIQRKLWIVAWPLMRRYDYVM